jgi:hypothetical protein
VYSHVDVLRESKCFSYFVVYVRNIYISNLVSITNNNEQSAKTMIKAQQSQVKSRKKNDIGQCWSSNCENL